MLYEAMWNPVTSPLIVGGEGADGVSGLGISVGQGLDLPIGRYFGVAIIFFAVEIAGTGNEVNADRSVDISLAAGDPIRPHIVVSWAFDPRSIATGRAASRTRTNNSKINTKGSLMKCHRIIILLTCIINGI